MNSVHVRVRSRPDRRLLQLFYVDPLTGKDRTKSADTDDPAEAERAAALWQQQLESSGRIGGRITWALFTVRVLDEYLPGLSKKTRAAYKTAMNHLTAAVGDVWLHEIDAAVLSEAQAKWRKDGMGETSIGTHLRHLCALFSWATTLKLLAEAPAVRAPKRTKRRLQRGRAITEKEFRLMVKHAEPPYKRIIEGVWLSGLRLNEAVALSWDSPPIRVDLDSGKYPRLIIHSEGQKSRKDEIVPIAPDFADFLRKTPESKRKGLVFPVPLATFENVGRAISDAGEKAGIVVNEQGKFASAQDLRSAFGTRWKRKVHPLTLKLMMRHRDLSTTLNYYVDDDCDEAAEEIWKCTDDCTEKERSVQPSRNGNTKKTRRK